MKDVLKTIQENLEKLEKKKGNRSAGSDWISVMDVANLARIIILMEKKLLLKQ